MVAFNPDVPAVGIPDENNATRPISRVESNKGPAVLGEGIGGGLKDLGQLYKDTYKVIDYTNKNELDNRISIDAGSVRDERINIELGRNKTLEEGGLLSQEDTNREVPFSPQTLRKNAATLAAAKAEESQLDLWYKARIDNLAKYYRATYPEYRDYVDKVFKDQGFGNTANELLEAAQKNYLRLQQGQSDNTKSQLAWLDAHTGNDPDYVAKMYPRIAAGDQQAWADAQRTLGRYDNVKLATEQRERELTIQSKSRQEQSEGVSSIASEYFGGTVAAEMAKHSEEAGVMNLGDSVDYIRQIERNPNLIDDEKMGQIQASGTATINRLESNFNAWGQQRIPIKDAFGRDTGKTESRMSLMGTNAFNDAKKTALEPVQQMISAINSGNMPLAHYMSQQVQAYQDKFALKQYHDPSLSGAMLSAKFFDNVSPKIGQAFFAALQNDPNIGKLNTSIQNAAMNWNVSFFQPDAPSIAAGLKAIGNSPGANRSLLQFPLSQAVKPDMPPSLAKNAFHANFQSENNSITEGMSNEDRVKVFNDRTSEAVAAKMKSMDSGTIQEWGQWTTHEFNHVLLPKELASLPEFSKEDNRITVGWDDQTHRFTLSSGNLHQLETWGTAHWEQARRGAMSVRGFGAGSIDVPLAQRVAQTVNRINSGLGGVQRVGQVLGERDMNAFLINTMKAGGHTDNKFWDAISMIGEHQKQQRMEEEKKAAEKKKKSE
jgi:hypothetical protein